jgi:putative DNA base modification enzyme with NMAD domain
MAAFLANVGVNAGHAARSPLRQDGTFRLVPIPEKLPWRPPMLRFADLGETVPATWRRRAAHLDPDLTGPVATYGDNCRHAGRAFSLRRADADDLIVFMARLHPARFALVGCLAIDDVLADVTAEPGPGWWDTNAHVRRGRVHGLWNSFWVFKGGSGSRMFERAQPFGRHQAEAVFGTGWRWRPQRTELQTIASYTRAVRRIEGTGETWLRTTCLS